MTKKINQVLIAVVIILLMYLFVDKIKMDPKTDTSETEISTGYVIETTGEIDQITWALSTGKISTWVIIPVTSQETKLLQIYTGIEDAAMHIQNMLLIRDYYNAIQNKNFAAASAFTYSGEISVEKLQKNYSNVQDIHPFKIENITDTLYHFYAVYLESGSKTPMVYSIKKQIVDGKLKTMWLTQIKANAETEHFKYYSDMYLTFNKKVEDFAQLFTAQSLSQNRCSQYGAKSADAFSGIINTLKKQKIAKYTFSFLPTKSFREKNESDKKFIWSWATVYVVPNNGLYKTKQEFMKDFDLCSAGWLKPLLINQQYMIFLDRGSDIAAILAASIQIK